MKQQKNDFSRRNFIGTVAAAGAVMMACNGGKINTSNMPTFQDQAPDGKELKAGLIGCGGRGSGAALNFLAAGPNLKIVALADVFNDRLQSCKEKIAKQANNKVPEENCFIGFDAYQKLIALNELDIIMIATPPHFRPVHFEAAVNAKKNVFMEKPVAVDPPGARSIMANAKKAEQLGLNVVTGTQRHHQRDYVSTLKLINDGAIGDIVSANCYWNGGQLWYRTRQKGWSEMEWMIRDWVNWTWLSGDHIVEQHVHNIDVINWFTGEKPVKALGFGARQRRVTGDQYDMFSVDFTYESGMHVHSMCRQINGCDRNISEFVQGTKGSSNCKNTIWKPDRTEAWKYEYPKDENGESTGNVKVSPYVQEHIALVTAIRNNTHINEAEATAISTMAAIMGRMSAYTGKEVTWEEVMNSQLHLGPKEYKLGNVGIKAVIPVPGTDEK